MAQPLTDKILTLLKSSLGKNTQDSIVVGIIGSWGTGKSTLMNSVRDVAKEDEELLFTKPVNAWATMGNPDIFMHQVYDSVSKAIDPDGRKDLPSLEEEEVTSISLPYKKVFLVVAALLFISFCFLTIFFPDLFLNKDNVILSKSSDCLWGCQHIQIPTNRYNLEAIFPELSPHVELFFLIAQCFLPLLLVLLAGWQLTYTRKPKPDHVNYVDKWDELISKLPDKKRLVIVIDDIDRLDPQEAWNILGLIRSIINSPKVALLIAVDHVKLAPIEKNDPLESSKSTYGDITLGRLDKILTYRVYIPPPTDGDIKVMFKNIMGEEISGDIKAYTNLLSEFGGANLRLMERSLLSLKHILVQNKTIDKTKNLTPLLAMLMSYKYAIDYISLTNVENFRLAYKSLYLLGTEQRYTEQTIKNLLSRLKISHTNDYLTIVTNLMFKAAAEPKQFAVGYDFLFGKEINEKEEFEDAELVGLINSNQYATQLTVLALSEKDFDLGKKVQNHVTELIQINEKFTVEFIECLRQTPSISLGVIRYLIDYLKQKPLADNDNKKLFEELVQIVDNCTSEEIIEIVGNIKQSLEFNNKTDPRNEIIYKINYDLIKVSQTYALIVLHKLEKYPNDVEEVMRSIYLNGTIKATAKNDPLLNNLITISDERIRNSIKKWLNS